MSEKAILCVDDELIILESLKEQLKREFGDNFQIEVAESGEDALAVIADLSVRNVEIPVIISDHIMPGMKGDELLESVHKKHPKLKLLSAKTIKPLHFRFMIKEWEFPKMNWKPFLTNLSNPLRLKLEQGGTGLGLSICREIIVAHQGSIWAANSQAGGAIFCFEIPTNLEPTSLGDSGVFKPC